MSAWLVCTEPFRALALSLGADSDRLVVVPHPIADLPHDAVDALAEQAVASTSGLREMLVVPDEA